MTTYLHAARVTAALLLAAALAGCAGQADGAGAPPPTLDGPGTPGCDQARPTPSAIETAGATMYPTSIDLDQALGLIQQDAESGRFADRYAGAEVVPEKGHAIVYRVPSAEFDAHVASIAGAECIYLRDARFSHQELQKLADRVSGDLKHWRGRGITINTVGTKHDGSGITVGTEQVEQASRELPKRYGVTVPIEIEQAGPVRPL